MQNKKLEELKKKIWIGTQYYRAPTPLPEDWEGDLKVMRKNGISLLQLRVQWRWHESVKGQYKWDDLDKILELCEENNIDVIFKFMLETAPEWLLNKYDCERVDPLGNKHNAGAHAAYYVGGWWPCFDREDVRLEATEFIKAAVNRYVTNKRIIGWSIWNEPRRRNTGDCACSESNRKYRLWLEERFGTIEKLNNFLGKAWGSFDDVKPPTMHGDFTEMYFWKEGSAVLLANQLQWVSDTIRKIDNVRPLITHPGTPRIKADVIRDVCDDHLNVKTVDWYGTSYWIPKFSSNPHSFSMNGITNDWIASVSDYYWIYELYANTPMWQKPALPEDIKFQTLFSIMSGAKGIMYWQYKNERFGVESNGFGLVNIDGSETDRIEAVKEITDLVDNHDEIINAHRPRAKVAIYYDHQSDGMARLEETTNDNIVWNFNDKPENVIARYKKSLNGIYELLWQMNIQVDFVSRGNIGKLTDYKVVMMPFPIMVNTESEVKVLFEFVKNGGTLISDPSPAAREENTWVSIKVPGEGLDKLFGCVETGKLYLQENDDGEEIQIDGKTIKAVGVQTVLTPTTGKIIGSWKNDEGAIIHNKYGKGQTFLFGTLIGSSFVKSHSDKDSFLFELISKLILKNSGPIQFKISHNEMITMRYLEGNDYFVCGLFNFSDKNQKVTVTPKNKPNRASTLFGNKAQLKDGRIEVNLKKRTISIFKVF